LNIFITLPLETRKCQIDFFHLVLCIRNVMYCSHSLVVCSYIAPGGVYSTARTLGDSNTINGNFNITWILPVDTGYSYFVRLHFCELAYTRVSERVFNVYNNNQTAPSDFDILIAPSLAGTNPTSAADTAAPATTTTISKSHTGAIIGAVVGGVAVVLVLVALVCYCCFCKAKQSKPATPMWLPLPLHGGSTDHRVIFNQVCKESEEWCWELCVLLEAGGLGKVYKGEIDDDSKVAVKRGNPRSEQGLTLGPNIN
jgi:hypothetical protein